MVLLFLLFVFFRACNFFLSFCFVVVLIVSFVSSSSEFGWFCFLVLSGDRRLLVFFFVFFFQENMPLLPEHRCCLGDVGAVNACVICRRGPLKVCSHAIGDAC